MTKTVLLIDDSQTVLDLVGAALRERGFAVLCESDVFAASRHVHRGRVDLILLDVTMPLVGGGEVCRILKGREETRSIPILLFSDLAAADLERLVAESGADGWLTKAAGLPHLVAAVERRLS